MRSSKALMTFFSSLANLYHLEEVAKRQQQWASRIAEEARKEHLKQVDKSRS